MKRIIPLLFVCGTAAILVLCVGATSPEPPERSSEIEQLRKEVDSLRQRVESLEKQWKAQPFIIPREGPRVVPPPCWPYGAPKGSKPFDWRCVPFYVIPLDTSHAPAPEAGK